MTPSSSSSLKRKRSVSPDAGLISSSVVAGNPVQCTAVRNFQENLTAGLRSACVAGLMDDLESLTWPGSPFEWLEEPLDMGFTVGEVVNLLLEETEYRPWIPYEGYVSIDSIPGRMATEIHQPRCVHQSLDGPRQFLDVPKPLKCQERVRPKWRKEVTALATSVCQYRYTDKWERVPKQRLQHGQKYWMGDTDEPTKVIAEVAGGQGNKVVLKLTNGLMPWSFYLRAHVRYGGKKTNCILLREQSYV